MSTLGNLLSKSRRGYTVVELMVTVTIVVFLLATASVWVVKLLTIQEREREEAYVRERLSYICGAYADALSVGSSITTGVVSNEQATLLVKYRQETGGVSLETGVVSRVAYVKLNTANNMANMDVYGLVPGQRDLESAISKSIDRKLRGDADLIALPGDLVSCTITPFGTGEPPADTPVSARDRFYFQRLEPNASSFYPTDAELGYLEVKAQYKVKSRNGETETKTVKAGRFVRLWNRE